MKLFPYLASLGVRDPTANYYRKSFEYRFGLATIQQPQTIQSAMIYKRSNRSSRFKSTHESACTVFRSKSICKSPDSYVFLSLLIIQVLANIEPILGYREADYSFVVG